MNRQVCVWMIWLHERSEVYFCGSSLVELFQLQKDAVSSAEMRIRAGRRRFFECVLLGSRLCAD